MDTNPHSKQYFRSFKIVIQQQDIYKNLDIKLADMQKNYSMPGFRKGAVPMSLIRNKKSGEEYQKVLEKMLQNKIRSIIDENQLDVLGNPKTTIVSSTKDKIEFQLDTYLYPNLRYVKWKEIIVQKPNIQFSDSDIESAKRVLLSRFMKFNDTTPEYKIQRTDKVMIDFTATINDKAFEGSQQHGLSFIVGSNEFLYDIEEFCIDKTVGQYDNIPIQFPKHYPQKQLAGHTATFHISINKVMQSCMPKISQQILQQINVASEQELNSKILMKLKHDFIPLTRLYMKKMFLSNVIKTLDITVPDYLVTQDVEYLEQDQKFLEENNINSKEKIISFSTNRIKTALVVTTISNQYDVTITSAEFDKALDQEIKNNSQKKAELLEFYQNSQNVEQTKRAMLEEKVFDFLMNKVSLQNVDMNSGKFLSTIQNLSSAHE